MKRLLKACVIRVAAHQRDEGGESGQGLAEYALILALVALVCVVALGGLGQTIAASPGFSLP